MAWWWVSVSCGFVNWLVRGVLGCPTPGRGLFVRHGEGMWKIPVSVREECPGTWGELSGVSSAPRGGVGWDPFSAFPEVRLSADAHRELLGALGDGRFEDSDEKWVRLVVLASVAPLLASRVTAARARFHRRVGDEAELMSVALEAAQSALLSWSPAGAASFHGYVIRVVDAALSRCAGMDSSHGQMPRSWQYAMRMLPSLRDAFRGRVGRDPSVEELREEYLRSSRRWAEGLVDVDACEDVEAEVESRMRAAGVFAVASRFSEVCAAAPTPLPLDAPGGADVLGGAGGAEEEALAELGGARARGIEELLSLLGVKELGGAAGVLSSPAVVWFHREGPVAVERREVPRRGPSDDELLQGWLAGS